MTFRAEFQDRLIKLLDYFERRLVEYDRIFFSNPLVIARAKGIGTLKREEAIRLGLTGPVLQGRASSTMSARWNHTAPMLT